MWVWGFGNHKWYKSLVKSRVADEWLDKRLLFHAWFPKPHTHISALTALALLKTTNKRYEIRNEMRYLFERNEIFKHFGQCTHMWLHWLLQISNFTKKLVKLMLVKINVLTCDYIDFYKLAISQDKKLVKLMLVKSQCTHIWVHWLLFCTCDYIDCNILNV